MTYQNPVLPGFYPDPSVCRVDNEYYLVASSFVYCPGVPIFRSRNLVDWTQIGHVLDRPSQLDLTATRGWASLGVYAPTIRYHDDRFWMITTTLGSGGAVNFFVTGDDPAGPWSDPVVVPIGGIDPDLAWDDEGHCWLHFSTGGDIARCRLDPATGDLLSQPEPTWSGTGLQYPEAPHLFEHDGRWYLLIAEGGTQSGHCISIARGPTPVGPWEGAPANPVLSHRSTDAPVQNTGHGDMVEAMDGTWWMVLLGVRPRGLSPGFHTLGRETFLTSVQWVDGWPVPGTLLLEMATAPGRHEPHPPIVRETFDGPTLPRHWVGVRAFPDTLTSLTARPGWLTLHGGEATLDSPEPTFVGRRQQHHHCRVRTCVEPGPTTEAGVSVYLDETAHYDVAVSGDRVVARARVGPFDAVMGDAPRPGGPVVLTVGTGPHAHGPDTVSLGFEDARGRPHILAALDGRYLSTEVTGGFLGRMIGPYAVKGDAAFQWFDYDET